MDLEDLIDLFRYYSREADEYDKRLEYAIEINDYEFGNRGGGDDKRKAFEELEEGLNKYIDQRIGLFLNQVISEVKTHYNTED